MVLTKTLQRDVTKETFVSQSLEDFMLYIEDACQQNQDEANSPMREFPRIASKQQPLSEYQNFDDQESGGLDPFAIALASPDKRDFSMKGEDDY